MEYIFISKNKKYKQIKKTENMESIKAIQVKKTGNLLIEFENNHYWLKEDGTPYYTATLADYEEKSKIARNGITNTLSFIDIDPVTYDLKEKIKKYLYEKMHPNKKGKDWHRTVNTHKCP